MTALVSRMRLVRSAAAASRSAGAEAEVGPVMLADAEHVEADLVGELDLLDQVAQPPVRADAVPGRDRGRSAKV